MQDQESLMQIDTVMQIDTKIAKSETYLQDLLKLKTSTKEIKIAIDKDEEIVIFKEKVYKVPFKEHAETYLPSAEQQFSID